MEKEIKNSIIKDALIDYKEIMEAASNTAKKKLADEFPDSFNKLLNEELKNKKIKESYKKIDENEESESTDDNNETNNSEMKNKKEETEKVKNESVKSKPFETKPKKEVKEDVKITDTVGDGDPFKEKKGVKTLEEKQDKDFVGDVEGSTPNLGKGKTNKGVAFDQKIKGKEKPISNLKEEFDLSEIDPDGVENTLDSADDNDMISLDDIETEISEMEDLENDLETTDDESMEGDDSFGEETPEMGDETEDPNEDFISKISRIKDELEELIASYEGDTESEMDGETEISEYNDLNFDEMSPDEFSSELNEYDIDLDDDDEFDLDLPMDDKSGLAKHAASKEMERHYSKPGSYDLPSDKWPRHKIKDDTDFSYDDIDEAHGVSYSAGATMNSKLPQNDYLSAGEIDQRRFAQMNESKKKVNSLINENKKLTKKINEFKKQNEKYSTLVEGYKSVLEKYRNQLKEMAVFNTNLAHVNNLFINESLALTQTDKVNIVNEFKKINTITESQNKYKSLLSEMKISKKSISESFEGKVSTSIQPSSKQKLDEVIEKTAYSNNPTFNKMMSTINYMEKRGK